MPIATFPVDMDEAVCPEGATAPREGEGGRAEDDDEEDEDEEDDDDDEEEEEEEEERDEGKVAE